MLCKSGDLTSYYRGAASLDTRDLSMLVTLVGKKIISDTYLVLVPSPD